MKQEVNYAKGITGKTIEISATELQVLKTKMQAIDADAKMMERNEINSELLINLKEMSTFINKICGKEIVSLQEAEQELFSEEEVLNTKELNELIDESTPGYNQSMFVDNDGNADDDDKITTA